MNMIKLAMTGAAALGLVLVGTAANAEQIRAAGATPGVVSVKKAKLKRVAAPAGRESQAVAVVPLVIVAVAATTAGVAVGTASQSSDSP